MAILESVRPKQLIKLKKKLYSFCNFIEKSNFFDFGFSLLFQMVAKTINFCSVMKNYQWKLNL